MLTLRTLLIVSLIATALASAQDLAQQLGFPPGTKLVIIHADDLGETHAVNAAAIKALESGTVNSASLMVPCPWFPEMADYAKSHPGADLGLHLTLTSERVYYRWGPAASRDKVPTLVDSNGYFHHDWEEHQKINPQEVESELRAQVERALAMGVHPTHLDSHQYRLIMSGKELFDAMLRVAHDYKLPVFVNRDWFAEHPYLESSLSPGDIVLDHTVTIEPEVPAEKWADFYLNALKNLKPGVTEFVIHPGFDDEELRAATRERSTWGAAWRQRDYDFFTSERFREVLAQENIKLITWRELVERWRTKSAHTHIQ
ncbi:MAG TPA: polysaccharide deacetylase family protein [Candidatus Sulfotelmatobacter sp.]|nr:polysaccharide deacetylase family protein [Candidatus Sulfotelmatobacter sp.]